jgi:hypothetical protein
VQGRLPEYYVADRNPGGTVTVESGELLKYPTDNGTGDLIHQRIIPSSVRRVSVCINHRGLGHNTDEFKTS